MKKGLLLGSAAILAPATLVGAAVFANNPNIIFKRALGVNAYTVVLDDTNSPTLSGGDGTVVDRRGIVWEYHNASYYSEGHVELHHQGYLGVAATSPYGINYTTNLSASFDSNDNAELWLLKSTDGITWGEDCILESDQYVTSAEGWSYLRFYNYATDGSSIDINSITINYSCTSISATEDVDSAKASNVISASSNLSYAAEYSDISPNSVGGEAISFEKTGSSNTEIILGFGKTYTVGDIQNSKIEFDMKTSNINYGKTITLMKNSSSISSSIESSKSNAYKCTNIQDDWYHIEVPVTAFISTISGYNNKDIPAKNVESKEVNGIKINAGSCIIDNLRLNASQCDLGIFNNPTYKPAVDEYFWLKVAWVGKLYPEQCTITFSDNTLARHIPLSDPNLKNGSPFYIQLLGSGTVTATATVVCGYNRQVKTISHTIVIN